MIVYRTDLTERVCIELFGPGGEWVCCNRRSVTWVVCILKRSGLVKANLWLVEIEGWPCEDEINGINSLCSVRKCASALMKCG